MDISPQRVRTAEFATVKRGLDPDEVRRFLGEVADELERAQNQSTAMEARARAAVARLQELSEGADAQAGKAAAPTGEVTPSPDQAETISRTLLLAQRTADTTIADARSEAERITGAANEEASRTLETTREMSARLLDEAREEARRVGQAERQHVESEVNSLMARRDFLESDVDHLERFLVEQRGRLREAASALVEVAERVPSGLGEVRRPLLSAADDTPADGAGQPGADLAAGADSPVEDAAPVPDAPTWDATSASDVGEATGSPGTSPIGAFLTQETAVSSTPPTVGDGPTDGGTDATASDDVGLLAGADDDLVIITDLAEDDADDDADGPVAFSYDDPSSDNTPPGTFRFGS